MEVKLVMTMGASACCTTRAERRAMYAPMPMARPVTYDSVKMSRYALDVAFAIRPEPCGRNRSGVPAPTKRMTKK
eukprot:1192810-Prorocentrum_minimum.AAC.6